MQRFFFLVSLFWSSCLWQSIDGYQINSAFSFSSQSFLENKNFKRNLRLEASSTSSSSSSASDPILLRAARGEKVERTPVWMMRQAGRHMKAYRDLCEKYKTFRERSEIVDVATEISLQPWRAYQVDGCILFSDILTPLPGMGIEFDILENGGPKIKPITSKEEIEKIHPIDPEKATPFIGQILSNLKHEIRHSQTTLLGFIGAPFTLSSYLIEGGSSKDYHKIKSFAYQHPALLHTLLEKIANNLADYACYQIEKGAQIIQLFDSWAAELSSKDYDEFALPYQKMTIQKIKSKYPNVPLILYIHGSGGVLEKMVSSGIDIISLDWTVSIDDARKRIGENIGIQGNLDPMILHAPKDLIRERTIEILQQGKGHRHVMNLGHGIDAKTPEENAKFFVDTVKSFRL